jgi:hypothetical protein
VKRLIVIDPKVRMYHVCVCVSACPPLPLQASCSHLWCVCVGVQSQRTVGSLSLRTPIVVSPQCPLIDLLNTFQVLPR